MFSFICVLIYIVVTARTFQCASVSVNSPQPGTTVATSRDYIPSISELSVPSRENPKIILANFPKKSVTLPLLNGLTSAANYFVHLARQAGNSDPGFFIVEAPKGQGVMAVIQQLHLRRISDSHSLLQLVNNCKDYLMFEGFNGEKTGLICGSVEKGDNTFYPTNLNGPKFFNSPDGRIKVTFRNHYSYGNELIAQNDSFVKNNQEIITVEITFTAYTKCQTAEEAKGKFQCTLEKCIDPALVCDNVVNCSPGENQGHFGVDETNCTVKTHHHLNHHHHHNREHFQKDDDDGEEDENTNNEDGATPPRMTTILILVGALILITICGYFWSWITQLCCVARSLFKSAEVGVEGQQQQQQQQQQQVFSAASTPVPRLPVAYYVPAVVLRSAPSSRNNNNNTLNSQNNNNNSMSSDDTHACLKQQSDDSPPSYDLLFGNSK